jgi:uncharacterized membrane protein SirB2
MTYVLLKAVHVSCVVLSGGGFVLRGYWMLTDSPLLLRGWVRVVPHIVDSLLLGSALSMAILSAQYPFAQNWLTAKFFGLLAYILCGAIALKRGRSKAQREVFLLLAIVTYLFIVSVALTRDALAGLAGAL